MSYTYNINEDSYSDGMSVVLLDEVLVTKTPFGKKFDISYSLFDSEFGYYYTPPSSSIGIANTNTEIAYKSYWFDERSVSNFLNTVIVLCLDESTFASINEKNYREPSKSKKIVIEPTRQKKQTNLKLSDFNLISHSQLTKLYSIPFKKTIDNISFDDANGFVGIYMINEFDVTEYRKQFNNPISSFINPPFISFRPYSAVLFQNGNYLKSQTFNVKVNREDAIWLKDQELVYREGIPTIIPTPDGSFLTIPGIPVLVPAADSSVITATFPLLVRDLSIIEDFSVLESSFFEPVENNSNILQKQSKNNSYFSNFYSVASDNNSQTTKFLIDYLNIIISNSVVYNSFSEDYKNSEDFLQDFVTQGSGIGSVSITVEPFFKNNFSAKNLKYKQIEVSSYQEKILGAEQYISIPTGIFLITLTDNNLKTYTVNQEIYYKIKASVSDPFAVQTTNDLAFSANSLNNMKRILNLVQNDKYYDFNKDRFIINVLYKDFPNIDADIQEAVEYYIKLKKKFSNYSRSLDQVDFLKIYELLAVENATYKNIKSFTESFEKIYDFAVKKTGLFNTTRVISYEIEHETDILFKTVNKPFYFSHIYDSPRKLFSNISILQDQSPDFGDYFMKSTTDFSTFFNLINLDKFYDFKKFYYETVSNKKIDSRKIDNFGKIINKTDAEINAEIDFYFVSFLPEYTTFFENIKKYNYNLITILNITSGAVDDRTKFIYREITGLQNVPENPVSALQPILSDTILDNFLKAFKEDPYFYQDINKFILFLAFFSSFYRFEYFSSHIRTVGLTGQMKNLSWKPVSEIPTSVVDIGMFRRTKIDLKEFLPRKNLHFIDIFGYNL